MATAAPIVPLRIGIDFGGVLAIHDKTRTSEDEEHGSVEINMPDALDSLVRLKEAGHRLYLISYCGERRAKETKQKLLKILPSKTFFDGLYFTQRPSHKLDVCQALGCDVMIEDRLKTLKHIQRTVPTMKFLWFSSSEEAAPDEMLKVDSWNSIMQAIGNMITTDAVRHEPNPRVALGERIHSI